MQRKVQHPGTARSTPDAPSSGTRSLLFGLAVVATVLITRGWQDEALQEQVREMEEWHESRGE